jgi:eukaryotic-like serine/threonine-protein kinase
MLGPVTRAVVNLGSSTVNVPGSRSTATAGEYPVTSQASSPGTQQTGARSRSRASAGCGWWSSSSRLTHCAGLISSSLSESARPAWLGDRAAAAAHRDLKPANVLLASDGPRVIDFGISRAVTDSRLTATGAIIGTPSFMSPEQVEGNAAGPPSDVFSLGSVLAFAACGAPPFSVSPGGSSASVLYRVVHATPELGMVPAEMRDLVRACLAKEAEWRPDLGQVAARSTAAAEYLGMSPVAFWPAEVARVIEAQQAAMAAEAAALPVPRAGPFLLGSPGPAGPSALPGPSGARVNVSRRNLLIGAGTGAAVVVGGVAAD